MQPLVYRRAWAARRLLLVLAVSCATPPPAVPGAGPTGASPRAQQPAPPAPPVPPPPVVAPATEPAPLPWVNPARCLSPCTLDPTADLLRIDAGGALDAQGVHRVARAVHPALAALLGAAAGAGHTLTVNSAFRSYDDQARLYRSIKQPGRAAMPGQSEHQMGTAVDLKLPSPEAADWLAQHAHEFGFVRSYPQGKQKITGYRPEPWHVRFVGRPLAEEVQRKGLTLEELFRQRPDLGVSGSCQDCPARAPRKPCGKITAAGACKGVLLSWCYEGALATVDCSAFEQRCETSGGQSDCR